MGFLEKLFKRGSSRTISTPTAPNSEIGIVEPRFEQGEWNLGVKTQVNTNGLELKIAGKTPDAPPDFRFGVVNPLTFKLDVGVGSSHLYASVRKTPRSFIAAGRVQMGITDDIPMPKTPIIEEAFFRQRDSRATVELGIGTNILGISRGPFSLGIGENTSVALTAGHTNSLTEIGARIIRQGPFVVVDRDGQTPLFIVK